MKSYQPWVLFLKYPYAAAVLACIWIGSVIMAFANRTLPLFNIVVINMLASWVITWMSFRSNSLK